MKENLYSQIIPFPPNCAPSGVEAQQRTSFGPSISEDKQSRLVTLACQEAEVYFTSPEKNFQLPHSSSRHLRSERRESCLAIFKVLLTHLDFETLCIGCWSPQGDFIPLDMTTISSESGLCRRRCERAISHLKTIGFVSVFPPQHHNNPVPYAGLRVIRAITPTFFEWAGLTELLEQVRADALHNIEANGGQP